MFSTKQVFLLVSGDVFPSKHAMPEFIVIIILGIIEGITEFLPISSTGHLLIAEQLMVKWNWIAHQQSDTFNVVIQAGAVLAVIPLFKQRFHQFIFEWQKPATMDYLLKILVAFVITGTIGLVVEKRLKLTEAPAPVAWALLIGGIVFLVVEYIIKGKRPEEYVTWTVAIAVGLGQLVAVIFPGASRSGTTIMIALLLGLSRPAATEFSFLVGIPTMLAASGYKIFKALHHPKVAEITLGNTQLTLTSPSIAPKEDWGMILLASVVAAVVSFIAVKWLLRYVQSHTFNAFGWYRIVVGILILIFFVVGH
jgi:undecaprenyl-diphosphatase